MQFKKSILTLLLGLGLSAGASGAYADDLAPVSPITITGPTFPQLAPHITTRTDHCRYIVTGEFFTANGQVTFDVHNVSTGVEVLSHVATNGIGHFATSVYIASHTDFYLKVYAVDEAKHETSNVIGADVSCNA